MSESEIIMAEVPLQRSFPAVIDNTNRSSFRKCETYWQYANINRIKPATPSIHLHAGAAFAKGIETVRRAFWESKASPADALALGIHALITHFGDFVIDEGHNKSCERLCQALISYFDQYPIDADSIQPFHNVEADTYGIEFSFAITIPDDDGSPILHPDSGDPLIYGGKFDMLGVRDNVLFVTDEKTTSQLGNAWLKQWSLDSQFTGYCWAAQQYGYPVAGAIIRGISFLKNGNGHAEAVIFRPQWQIDRWLNELRRDVKRMIELYKNPQLGVSMAIDKSICGNYGGCGYSMLCESPNPESWIPLHYAKNTWNPLAVEE